MDADLPSSSSLPRVKGNVSFPMTMVNNLKCFLGIGILATPSAFQKIGIIGANVGMVFVAGLAYYTMALQIKAVEKVDRGIRSYSELGYAVLGGSAKMFLDICLVFSQLGFCIAYLIFIGNQMDQVICLETDLEFCDQKALYILLAITILVPLTWLRDMRYLGYVSMLSNFLLVISCK